MVSKLKSEARRWSGSTKHPNDGDKYQQEKPRENEGERDRYYVDFGNQMASEAAVERWLMGRPSNSNLAPRSSPIESPASTPTNREGKEMATTSNLKATSATPSTPRMVTPKYSPMQGKRILRERLQSRTKLAGKSSINEGQQPATVTPPPSGIRVRMSRDASSVASNDFSSSAAADTPSDKYHFHSQSDLVEEAFQNKMLLTVISSESSNGNAKHPRRSIQNLTVDTSPSILGTVSEEDLASPHHCDGYSPARSSSSTKSKRQFGGWDSTTCRRPSSDTTSKSRSAGVRKHFFASSGRRNTFSAGDSSPTTSDDTESSIERNSTKPSSFRRGRSFNSVETERTSESSLNQSILRRRRSSSRGRKMGGSSSRNNENSRESWETKGTCNDPILVHSSDCFPFPSGWPEASIVKEQGTRERQNKKQEKQQRPSPPPPPPPPLKMIGPQVSNRIKLNIYDLLANEVIMALPFGLHFPIGQCFGVVNSGLHNLGTGAYHVGIEINGIEYAYGANSTEGVTGIFACVPRHSPGYQYRTAIDFGARTLVRKIQLITPDGKDEPRKRQVDGREVIREMTEDYMGMDYDLLRKNCCTFAHDACLRLGISKNEIPSWFRNLADAGGTLQDAANLTIEPIQQVFSACGDIDMETAFDAGAVEECTLPTHSVNQHDGMD